MARPIVFVFGSNLAGRHGKGAALEAVKNWGAQYGVGRGRTGNAYALPTKDERLKTLPLSEIQQEWIAFWKYAARDEEGTQFLLTPFGTGLAGYSIGEIRSIMTGQPLQNVWYTGDWYL